MKEYFVKYRVDTLWNRKGGQVSSNHYSDVVSADSGKEAVKKIFSDYQNILQIPTKSLEIESVKLVGSF